jgi:hypothetical protein
MKVTIVLEFHLPECELDDTTRETFDDIRVNANLWAENKINEDKPFAYVTDPKLSFYDVTVE